MAGRMLCKQELIGNFCGATVYRGILARNRDDDDTYILLSAPRESSHMITHQIRSKKGGTIL
jgi:hypothetical protein